MVTAMMLAGVLWASALIFVVGLAWRLWIWLSSPVLPGAALMPAPRSRVGVLRRVLLEVFAFRSLYRAGRWTWAMGITLHAALGLALAGHLLFLAGPAAGGLPETHWLAPVVGVVLLLALAGLAARRCLVDRLRYISTPSDYLWLALLAALGLSGLWLGAQDEALTDDLRRYVLALLALRLTPLPDHPAAVVHLLLASALLAAFPFGKLLHAPGIVLAPSRTCRDVDRRVE